MFATPNGPMGAVLTCTRVAGLDDSLRVSPCAVPTGQGAARTGGQTAPRGRLSEQYLSGLLEDGVDLVFEVLDVIARKWACPAANQQRPAPLGLALPMAAQSAQEVLAQTHIGPGPDDQCGRQGSFRPSPH